MTLPSERAAFEAPLSFRGSAQRLWQLVKADVNPWVRFTLVVPGVLLAITMAWTVVFTWYAFFGIFLVPFRMLRRAGQRKKVEALRHREVMAALGGQRKAA